VTHSSATPPARRRVACVDRRSYSWKLGYSCLPQSSWKEPESRASGFHLALDCFDRDNLSLRSGASSL